MSRRRRGSAREQQQRRSRKRRVLIFFVFKRGEGGVSFFSFLLVEFSLISRILIRVFAAAQQRREVRAPRALVPAPDRPVRPPSTTENTRRRRLVNADDRSSSMSSVPRARRPPPPRALSSARRRSSAPLLLAALSAAALYGSGMLASVSQALSRPILNDVATDLENPPQFSSAAEAASGGAPKGPVPLPEEFKAQIKKAYPGLRPLEVADEDFSETKVFAALERLARARPGWEVTFVDAGAAVSTLQGVATTPLLRFKDDFVFRVKKGKDTEKFVVVDGRSRSRLGRGDLGANAARIESFFADLKRELDA